MRLLIVAVLLLIVGISWVAIRANRGRRRAALTFSHHTGRHTAQALKAVTA